MIPPTRPEELLDHAEWVRRLARSLVADEAAAADLVQDTWVAALRRPPPGDAALRPWLGRVLRHFAWKRHRSEARRVRREADAARPERVPPESETVERLEAQRRLVDVLTEVEEPLRTTLVGRYLEGLSAAEIARRDGVPAGTVRWRTQRGLARMRELLDARSGGERERWVTALLPLAVGPGTVPVPPAATSTTASTAVAGALAMNAVLKVSIVLAVVLTAALGWRAFGGGASSPDTARVAAPEVTAAAPELRAVEPEPVPDPGPSRPRPAARVALDAVEPAGDAPAGDAAASRAAVVRARFLDERGRPLAGARLARRGEPARSGVESGEDGRVALELDGPTDLPDWKTELRAVCASRATRLFDVGVTAGETTWLGDVVLPPGGRVVGRVVDGDRRPVAGATVELVDVELPPGELAFLRLQGPFLGRRGLVAATDDDGRFELPGADVGPARVWAVADGMRWTAGEPLEVLSDRAAQAELILEPLGREERVDGVVLDPDGRPCAEARLEYAYRSHGSRGTRTVALRADGTFTVVLAQPGRQWLTAVDGEGRYGRSERVEVAAGEAGLELRLRRLMEVAVGVRTPSGDPVSRYTAAVVYPGEGEGARGEREPRVEVRSDDGRGRIAVPARVFLVDLSAVGYEPRTLGPFGPEPPAEIAGELVPVTGLRGVVTHAGAPVPEADVLLLEPYGDGRRVERNGLRTWLRDDWTARTATDERGEFRLAVPAGGPFVVHVRHGDFATAEVGPLDLAHTRPELAVELTAGGAIEGRVRAPRGVDVAGTVVLVHRGVGRPRSVRVGPEGEFRFARLTPGDWEVRLSDEEVDPTNVSVSGETVDEPAPFPWNCRVFEGETTRHDLELAELAPCRIRGRLALPRGLSEPWTATVWPFGFFDSEPRELPTAELDPLGSFELATTERGRVRLALRSASGWRVTETIEVGAGDVDWSFGWEPGTLQGRVDDVPDVESPLYFVMRRDGVSVAVPLRPDEWGHFRQDGVPAGEGAVVRWEPGTESADPASWPVLGTVEVVAGRVTTADLGE